MQKSASGEGASAHKSLTQNKRKSGYIQENIQNNKTMKFTVEYPNVKKRLSNK